MSWSVRELKHKRTGRLAYDLENDTSQSHYLFDDSMNCVGYYDYGFDSMIDEYFDLVYPKDSEITIEEWNEIFATLKRKALEYVEETKYTIRDIYV